MFDQLVGPIPSEVKHDWRVIVDGQAIATSEIVASHPKLGTLCWGLRPEGTVGWIWMEVGGGGTGTVPYSIVNGHLMIGIIKQERATMPGGIAWNIPRGFLEPGLTHFQSAARETNEELGVEQLLASLKELRGEPANCNSTFFDTRAGNGFRYYCLDVPQSLLDCSKEHPVFRPGLFTPKSTTAERITQCHFVPWRIAACIADNFTNAGVARLISSNNAILQYL